MCAGQKEMDSCELLILLLTTVTPVTSDSVRLVNGGSRCAGRVEVLHKGQWGTVCDDFWDIRDAAVVCRELGCGEAIDAPRRARFGPGSGPIWLEYANCIGSESSLKNCISYDWGRQRCNHDEDAGAICAGVRLVGASHCSGRVEVLQKETWGTVCDFDQQDAEVVCQELGCGPPVELLGAAAFGRGEGQVWSNKIQCRGNESQIFFCPTSSSLKHNCSHENDVGLVCADSVRLVDGGSRCSGRVEVTYRGKWRSVCGKNWDMRDAAVVCRELNCGEAVRETVQFGPGSGWMDDVNCSGSEFSVKHCRSAGWVEQKCDDRAGVICSGVRVVNGSRCSGRVEVLQGKSWVTVCDADFDQQDAEVVCRELGCGLPVEVLGAAAFGRGEGQMWSEELQCQGNESQILFCPTSPSLKHTCSHDNDVGLVCAESVRLVDGGSRCAGRVEVLHNGTWGTVCDDYWDMRDAAVVCRQLGCGEAVDALCNSHFGSGSGPIWMDNVDCRESESMLKNCKSAGWGKHDCNHSKDAGVICSSIRLVGGSRCSGRVEVLHGETWVSMADSNFDQQDAEVVCQQLGCGHPVEVLGAAAQCTDNVSQNCSLENKVGLLCADSVRLVDGGSRCAGRVEVLHRGQWGTVCDDNWNMRNSAVVCGELGCGEAVVSLSKPHFGLGSGPVWMDDVDCTGSETSLKHCKSRGWGKHNCDHSKDAGVICLGVRLVNGTRCSGRVEVFHGESWVTVCDANFDQKDAEVVCRELSCGLPVEVRRASAFGRGEVQVWSKELQCTGHESHIYFCPASPSLKQDSSHYNTVGLVCADSVRLVDGGSRCAGRVEVLHRGKWGTVCDNAWDLKDAAVVCKELGCMKALSIAHFGSGSGKIWMNYVNCTGSESTLKNCKSAGGVEHNCAHVKDAGVICSGVRLVNGSHCSGRVEVLHGESWVTVCDADFDQQDAEVVCRELACGPPVKMLGAAAFGRGEGQMWSERFQCRGYESEISLCPRSLSLKPNCAHDSDVALICSDNIRLVNGSSHCAGRVEILHKGQWGTVCSDNWDMSDAAVVCRELGCGKAVKTLRNGHFGSGSGPIWMDNVHCSGSESSLKLCRSRGWNKHNCKHIADAGVICSGHKRRLVGGPHACCGRVEVLHRNSWVPVCDADFDQQDAKVLCQEIGCGFAVEVLGAAAFGRGEDQVWSEKHCRGNESQMYLCQTSPSLKQNCSHNYVEIICSGHTQSRLMNGSDSCSGRVELQYLSEWGTVCDVSWDMRAASVLCTQLNCGSAVAVLGSDWFGEGSGQIWADVFDCQGNETHLSQCPISSWSRTTCSHKQDAGLICSGSFLSNHEGRVRLSGGMECEGEVEVLFRQDWRRVHLDSWSETESSVVCRQLGCGSLHSIASSSPSSPGQTYTCVTGFNCSGSEAHLKNCSSAQAVNCSSTEQLYITCSGISYLGHRFIRLVGSGGDCAGRLEVFHNGSWGTVSDDMWDIKDAQVVCRQLQCGMALSAPVPAGFGAGTGSIWLDEVECEGNEVSLWNCRYQLCGEDECGHKDDVGVVCSEYKEIRLTEGCEGNLEVFYNGTWGNVCGNGMTEEAAKIICQELNCGKTGKESLSKTRMESAPNWLDDVKCRKHDSSLWHCPSSPWGQNRCDNRNEVASITCSENGNTLDLTNWTCTLSTQERQCSKHIPLRLRRGIESCSGWLEVYYNKTWGSVCGDLWDIKDSQVVCRQLGCGPALSVNKSAVVGSGGEIFWMNRVKCRGNEIHLWDCPHSRKKHTDCSQTAGVTCAGSQPERKREIFPQTPVPSIYPFSLLVLGTVVFLVLLLLAVLYYQNRVLRRVLSKKRRNTLHEPVYEEIDTRLITQRIPISAERDNEEAQEMYDVIFAGQRPNNAEEEDDYDDVTVEQSSNIVIENRLEIYDDVLTAGPITADYDDVESPQKE